MHQPARIPGTRIDILESPTTGRIRHAVLDFDGTLSLVRDGWQDIMVPLMVEILSECPRAEEPAALERLVMDFVDHLTGKQTIFQMIRLAEEVERRGGKPLDPLEYKQEYNRRILPVAEERLAGLESGEIEPERLRVPGALELLEALRERGVRLVLASGTDVEFVRAEASALGVADLFDGGIHGALPKVADFSKEKVIREILESLELEGPEILVMGDGYVEIVKGREVGAVTVGLVSPEGNHYHMNSDKRQRLERAGAHLLAEPDWREQAPLVEYLFTP